MEVNPTEERNDRVSTTTFNVAEHRAHLLSKIIFNDDALDYGAALWLCADADDVLAVGHNGFCLHDESALADDICRAFLKAFPAVFCAIADKKLRNGLASVLEAYGVSVLLPKNDGVFRGCHSLAELGGTFGDGAVKGVLMGARESASAFLLDVGDIAPQGERSYFLSGIPKLDKTLGGFARGEVTVLTGKRGCGKSTLVSQIALQAISEGEKVFLYSGELSASRCRQWLCQQAAGSQNLFHMVDKRSGLSDFGVSPKAEQKIIEWLKGKLFVYDTKRSNGCTADQLIDAMEYACRAHGCSVLICDNLMSLALVQGRGDDLFRQQSEFVGKLVQFSKKFDSHVFCIAHPRKTSGRLTGDDISGSADISNRVDNVLAIERAEDGNDLKADARLTVLKNRTFGRLGGIDLAFDDAQRRFYEAGDMSEHRYGWERS